jgi:hypothetical protein
LLAQKKKFFPIGFQTAQPKKRCAQGYSAFDTEQMPSQRCALDGKNHGNYGKTWENAEK